MHRHLHQVSVKNQPFHYDHKEHIKVNNSCSWAQPIGCLLPKTTQPSFTELPTSRGGKAKETKSQNLEEVFYRKSLVIFEMEQKIQQS